jgi:hypothetical protein
MVGGEEDNLKSTRDSNSFRVGNRKPEGQYDWASGHDVSHLLGCCSHMTVVSVSITKSPDTTKRDVG